MTGNKIEYVRFPLSFIRDMLLDKDIGMTKMLLYGICIVAKDSDVDEYNAYQQVMYCYYQYGKAEWYEREMRNPKTILPTSIKQLIDKLSDEDGFLDVDHCGFTSKFDVEEEVIALMRFTKNHKEWHEEIMAFHKLRQAAELFGVTIKNYDSLLSEFYKYSKAKTRMVSVKRSMILEYWKQPKTEYQIMLFAMYMAVKAIIGTKPLARTTKNFVMANTFGCMNEDELDRVMKENATIKELYDKYSTKRMWEKLTKDIQECGFVPEWLPMKKAGTFVSTKLNHKQFLKEVNKAIYDKGEIDTVRKRSAADYRKASIAELQEIRNAATG